MERTEFMRAVEIYRDTVYRVALHHFANPPDAEDAVQEVFLRLYTREEAFDSQEHLRRWLIRVTVNYCRDVLKSPWRRRRVSLDELPDQPVFDTPEQGELYQSVLALPEKIGWYWTYTTMRSSPPGRSVRCWDCGRRR